eukprot:7376445-Prymnesium_polylepis.1
MGTSGEVAAHTASWLSFSAPARRGSSCCCRRLRRWAHPRPALRLRCRRPPVRCRRRRRRHCGLAGAWRQLQTAAVGRGRPAIASEGGAREAMSGRERRSQQQRAGQSPQLVATARARAGAVSRVSRAHVAMQQGERGQGCARRVARIGRTVGGAPDRAARNGRRVAHRRRRGRRRVRADVEE